MREAMLAAEQDALRRVAGLVAGGAPPEQVFAAVAEEVATVLRVDVVELSRFDGGDAMTVVGAWTGRPHPFIPGTRWPLDGPTLSTRLRETGKPLRIDDYSGLGGTIAAAVRDAGIRSAAGAPIVVDGEVWGVMATASPGDEPLPEGIEERLADFTALVATAISTTQARADLRRLADQEAALRRLATLVAEGADAERVFDAVCEETGRLLRAHSVNLARFTDEDDSLTVAGWSLHDVHVPAGTRLPLDPGTIDALVRDTAAPGRVDSYDGVGGALAEVLRQRGVRSEVGAPVVVDGGVWGALIAGTDGPEPLPAGTEHDVARFGELVATAIANTAARAELLASRARIVAAADEQRRRVVRDLHDGAQQRLVRAVMTLQQARAQPDVPPALQPLLDEGLHHARAAVGELRELAHGIHPAILTHHGLAAAVDGLAERAPLPVEVDIPDDRFPPAIESAAYFVAAEGLTNVAKYARAAGARVAATRDGGGLVLTVEDDGDGGAAPAPGSGLTGLRDRVTALAGTLSIDSPPGGGTRLRAAFPLPAD
jgi:signal transduction histidine kinase